MKGVWVGSTSPCGTLHRVTNQAILPQLATKVKNDSFEGGLFNIFKKPCIFWGQNVKNQRTSSGCSHMGFNTQLFLSFYPLTCARRAKKCHIWWFLTRFSTNNSPCYRIFFSIDFLNQLWPPKMPSLEHGDKAFKSKSDS